MTTLRQFLEKEYGADPAAVSRFASTACQLVRVRRRWWRGRPAIARADVTVDGKVMNADATTQPHWSLVPDKMKAEFGSFEKAVDQILADYCVSKGRDEDGNEPLLIGDGTYAIDAAAWPRVKKLLEAVQSRWGAIADQWCTEDGYAELRTLVREKVGDETFAVVSDEIPDRQSLRTKFGLIVWPLPIRIAEDRGSDPNEAAGRRAAAVELIEASVRRPREDAAAAWEEFAEDLVTDTPVGLTAYHPVAVSKPGAPPEAKPRARTVRAASLAKCRRATLALARAERYLDPPLRAERDLVLAELPDAADTQAARAKKLNADDAEAVRVGRILLEAAAAARDESGMCIGVAAALDAAK